jgi:hypothetical protein
MYPLARREQFRRIERVNPAIINGWPGQENRSHQDLVVLGLAQHQCLGLQTRVFQMMLLMNSRVRPARTRLILDPMTKYDSLSNVHVSRVRRKNENNGIRDFGVTCPSGNLIMFWIRISLMCCLYQMISGVITNWCIMLSRMQCRVLLSPHLI